VAGGWGQFGRQTHRLQMMCLWRPLLDCSVQHGADFVELQKEQGPKQPLHVHTNKLSCRC